MFKIDIIELQNILQKPIERNITALGLDIASRTGWATAKTNSKEVEIDYGFIDIKIKEPNLRYNAFIEHFKSLIEPKHRIVIEDCFFSRNVLVLKLLARLSALAYAVAKLTEVKRDPIFVGPSQARNNIGIKGICKKPEVHKWLIDNLKINIKDEDASDAIVLALNGIIKL